MSDGQRDNLIQEITNAFAAVTREGGVSWSEAYARDNYGEPDECAEARKKDKDLSWVELLESSEWNPSPGIGGWSFLDSIGFRYYLPAGMIHSIREGFDTGLLFHLTLSENNLRGWRLEKWSLLDERQKHCVRRYLGYMAKVDEDEFDEWVAALNSYWNHAVPPGQQIVRSTEDAHAAYLQDRAARNLQITHIEQPKPSD